jgi:hypothetical protein
MMNKVKALIYYLSQVQENSLKKKPYLVGYSWVYLFGLEENFSALSGVFISFGLSKLNFNFDFVLLLIVNRSPQY